MRRTSGTPALDAISRDVRRRGRGADAEPYDEVLARANAAAKKFGEAQRRYRAREIGDAEFLAARREYDESEREFTRARGEAGSDTSDGPSSFLDLIDRWI